MSRPIARPNPTGCQLCAAAEAPPASLLTVGLAACAAVLALYKRPPRRSVPAAVRAQALMMAGLLSTLGPRDQPPVSDYEKHRQQWIATGQLIELDRMLRHPLPAQLGPGVTVSWRRQRGRRRAAAVLGWVLLAGSVLLAAGLAVAAAVSMG